MAEPDQVLRAFVNELPATIREIILAQACIAFDHFEARPDFDFSSAFDEILEMGKESWRVFRVAQMAGVIEVLLVPDPIQREVHEKLAKEHEDVEIFAKMALQAPLKERHLELARQSFQELRDGALSPLALRNWWNILQARASSH